MKQLKMAKELWSGGLMSFKKTDKMKRRNIWRTNNA
jgi:hypothetical protein